MLGRGGLLRRQPCLRAPCGAYLDCLSGAQADFDECIASIANNPRCRSTGGGRCTITLRVRQEMPDDPAEHRAQLPPPGVPHPRRLPAARSSNVGQQKSVARLCKTSCSDPIAPDDDDVDSTSSTSTSTARGTPPRLDHDLDDHRQRHAPTTTTVPASSCAGPDIGGASAPASCGSAASRRTTTAATSACNGDQCAENICKQTARNIACEAIRARCTQDGDNVGPAVPSLLRQRLPDARRRRRGALQDPPDDHEQLDDDVDEPGLDHEHDDDDARDRARDLRVGER